MSLKFMQPDINFWGNKFPTGLKTLIAKKNPQAHYLHDLFISVPHK